MTSVPQPSRRALLGAAWAAPVVVAAGAVPAYATSGPRLLAVSRYLDTKNGTYFGGDFRHDVQNAGPGETEALQATITITADDPAAWGENPTAEANFWTLAGVTGTGATRTFTFLADFPVGEGGGRTFDVYAYSDLGNLAPGSRSARVVDGASSASYGPERFVDFGDPSRRRAPRT